MKKRKKTKYRPLFRTCLFFARVFRRRRKVEGNIPDEPCVFLCRHLDESGVARSFIDVKTVMRPWVLDIFTEYGSAKKQFKEYTFSKRMKKGKLFCSVVSPIAAWGLTSLVKSARGIPVYRKDKSARSIQTVKKSVRALEEGDNLVIYADIDYADKSETQSGEIYEGFYTVDTLYYRRTGKRVPFVPVYIGKNKTVIHPPVYFESGKDEAIEKIRQGMFNDGTVPTSD